MNAFRFIMASARGDRRLMFFITIAIFVACLVAISAFVLTSILTSIVRSGNDPRASKLDTTVQGKRPKKPTSYSPCQIGKSPAYDVLYSKIWQYHELIY